MKNTQKILLLGLVVALSILLHPVSSMTPLELMEASNMWLGPLQGLVTAALGAFFRGEGRYGRGGLDAVGRHSENGAADPCPYGD